MITEMVKSPLPGNSHLPDTAKNGKYSMRVRPKVIVSSKGIQQYSPGSLLKGQSGRKHLNLPVAGFDNIFRIHRNQQEIITAQLCLRLQQPGNFTFADPVIRNISKKAPVNFFNKINFLLLIYTPKPWATVPVPVAANTFDKSCFSHC